jgi:hypothetical protein
MSKDAAKPAPTTAQGLSLHNSMFLVSAAADSVFAVLAP